ncbi:MAG: YbjQ family protein [Euryarchaeota archaeon]|nr:YbjQ family protein [Euryarchaeota archaeon]
MLISTTHEIPGKRVVAILGVVMGSTVRARFIGRDIIAGIRNIIGGEVKEYTKMMEDAREEAIARMVARAEELRANAVVGVRFVTAQVAQGAAELLAYGTAVVVEDLEG